MTAFKLFLIPALVGLFGFCHENPITVAPKPVVARTVSDWAKRNIIDFDDKGVIVTGEYVRVYKGMLGEYGAKLPVSERPDWPDTGIANIGPDRYRITFEVRDRFDDLRFYERNASP